MAIVIPFRGITYSPTRVPDLNLVVTPPYDVISPEKDEEYRRRHPHNIVHVILPRPTNGLDKYQTAASHIADWRKEGILTQDEQPCFYVVSQRYSVKGLGERTRYGLIGRVRIEDDDAKRILPHEQTMSAPREDRMSLLAATKMNLSQVFLLYADPQGTISGLVESQASRPPERWAVDDTGSESSLWRVASPDLLSAITNAFRDRVLWIADGHHRYAAARAFRDRMRGESPAAPGARAHDYVMAMLTSMDSDGVTILPYHRALKGQDRLDPASFASKAAEFFDVKEFTFEGFDSRSEQIRRRLREAARPARHLMAAYMGQGSYVLLILRETLDKARLFGEATDETLRELDVTVLHDLLLEKALGIPKEEQLQSGAVLRYTDDIDRAMSWVDAGEAQVALLVNPTRKEQLMAVSAAGLQMPQKSTYFFPKVPTGFVLNPLDPSEEISAGIADAP